MAYICIFRLTINSHHFEYFWHEMFLKYSREQNLCLSGITLRNSI